MRRARVGGRGRGVAGAAGAIVVVGLLFGCTSEQSLRLVLSGTEGLDASSYTVSVHDWDECPSLQQVLGGGEDAFGRLHRQTFRAGDAKPVGALPGRELRFAAVALDELCRPIASGCTPATVGASSRIEVELEGEASGSQPSCGTGQICERGRCEPQPCDAERSCPGGFACAEDEGVCKPTDGGCDCRETQSCCESPVGARVCVDVQGDPDHCGSCGASCGPGTFCVEAACEAPPWDRMRLELEVRGADELRPDDWLVGIVWLDVVGLHLEEPAPLPPEVGLALPLSHPAVELEAQQLSVPIGELRPPSSRLSCPGGCQDGSYAHIGFAHIVLTEDVNGNGHIDTPEEYIDWSASGSDRLPPRFGLADRGLIVSAAALEHPSEGLGRLESDTGRRFRSGIREGYAFYGTHPGAGLTPSGSNDSDLDVCAHEGTSIEAGCAASLPRPYAAY